MSYWNGFEINEKTSNRSQSLLTSLQLTLASWFLTPLARFNRLRGYHWTGADNRTDKCLQGNWDMNAKCIAFPSVQVPLDVHNCL